MEERIRTANAQCEEKIKQLQNERDARIAELKESMAMLAKLVEFEQREIGNVPPESPQHSLADFIEPVRDYLRDLTTSFSKIANRQWGPARGRAIDTVQEAEEMMKDNIAASLVVALGVGVLVGYLIRRGTE